MSHLSDKIKETLRYLRAVTNSANEDIKEGQKLIEEIRSLDSNSEEAVEKVKEFKFIQFFNNFKLTEVEKFLNIAVSLYELAKLNGEELDISEEDRNTLENSKSRIDPFYVVDKGGIQVINKDIEEAIKTELNSPSRNDSEAINKILNVIKNGK